ncbi:hypothetical protein BDV25DRAFT_168015 [Aspergillus avenaceus]|uniref:Rhodopsin domain-containing protein n=1 Tax=Aspergillus avenaceus TaxID=36643 RepID=A0A5N6TS37_ASPAV|nr:hypothetical protein BDV25DRAFT_168015 [Aspergillus avenaceus]
MGWVYNLETADPNSHIPRVIAISLVFPIFALLAVALRFYIRIHTKRSVWLDDYASLFSAVIGAGYGANTIVQTRWGLGLHFDYFPEANLIPFGKIQYAGGPLYAMALLGFKVSLLASYLRIGGFVKLYRAIIILAIVAVMCNQLLFTFLFIFPCRPVWYDIVIIALPLPVLWNLQLGQRQKIALGCVFAIGFFITIIQIIRIFSIQNLKVYTDSQPIIIWSIIETSLAVIVACVPTYGPYFRLFVSNISSYRRRPTGQTYRLTSGNHPTGRSSRKPGTSTLGRDDPGFELDESRPYDSSVPHTTMITSQGLAGDNESEEHILGKTSPQTYISGSEGGIQKVTEVTVERH